MDFQTSTFLVSFVFIIIGGIFVAYSFSFIDSYQISQRIQTYILEDREDARARDIGFRSINFSESLLRRTIVPFFNGIASFFGRLTPSQSVDEINKDLALAGVTWLRARQFYGLRIILRTLGIGWLAFDYYRRPEFNTLLVDGAVVIIMFILPILWLRMKVSRRREEIRRSLPDALDMLSVSTAAGLGFDQSMLKVSQFFNSAAAEEFARVVSEIEVGVSRQNALRNFADRVNVSEISSFVAVIVQSEILGMSIADVLHTQAEQMRIQRQYRAKELAQRLPVKMMVPLALLILPALLAVLLGPTVPAILEIF
jgi:tight adherence protein C